MGSNWPTNGEIDIFEAANMQGQSQFSLHTLNGCQHPPASSSTFETGNLISTDCFNQTANNEGCLVQAPSQVSYGPGFAAAGGGAYAMLWNNTGISMWFFQRSSIPSDLPSNSPNPAAWGTPIAFYPQSSCDFSKFFGPQTLILVRSTVDLCQVAIPLPYANPAIRTSIFAVVSGWEHSTKLVRRAIA